MTETKQSSLDSFDIKDFDDEAVYMSEAEAIDLEVWNEANDF